MVLYTDVVSVERTRTRVQALHATRARRETGESRAARARAARGVFTAEPKRSARHGSVSGKKRIAPLSVATRATRRARRRSHGRRAGVTSEKREKTQRAGAARAESRDVVSGRNGRRVTMIRSRVYVTWYETSRQSCARRSAHPGQSPTTWRHKCNVM